MRTPVKNTKKRPFNERSKARRRALQGLYQWHMTGQSPGKIVQQFLEEQDFRRVDIPYFKRLMQETAKASPELEKALAECTDRSVDSLDPMERTVLRLGAFELKLCLETPMRVVIDEAVELAKLFGSDQTPGFVNAVLDKFAVNARQIEYQAQSRD